MAHRAENHGSLSSKQRFFPVLLSWSISPKVTTQDPGRSIMEIISTILEITVGFSNGVDELAPKKPPPLVPDA